MPANWEQALIQSVISRVMDDSFWSRRIESYMTPGPMEYALHLAIFVEPYLQLILDGRKTVESRFSTVQCAPYRCIQAGDVILMKRAGGSLLGVSQVREVSFYQNGSDAWTTIRDRFGAEMCPDEAGFWDRMTAAVFGTVIRLERVLKLPPLACGKRDRRGWVVLRPALQQLFLKLP